MTLKSVEKSAKTVNDAIALALEELALSRDDVQIEVLDEGKPALLGFMGGRPAQVRVTQKETGALRACAFLEGVTSRMGLRATVQADQQEDALRVDVAGEGMGALIGHHGDTLDALQYLTSLVVNHHSEQYCRVTLDTENYRAKRAETLQRLAERMAAKAVRVGRVALEPMNPYERRILHTALQGNAQVTTHSEGEEPYRRVIIVRK
nr:RNA-binding cell elongation regulator Jag/EloR [Maliibacterium massiliense]